VLWKPAAEDEPGWDSPWGRGRPGWHLECSAMVRRHLGESIDIHGGGQDLIFPHHENERAQSCCAWGGDFVRYWMHNAYLDIDGEKMSKSLGNVRTVRDLLRHHRGEVLRFALLSAHYRSPLDFTAELLEQAESTLAGLYNTLRQVADIDAGAQGVDIAAEPVYEALCDDLHTPRAIAALHAIATNLHKAAPEQAPRLKARLLAAGGLLGLLQQDPEDWLQGGADAGAIGAEQVEALIEERLAAKREKNYARADAIREELAERGIVLEDSREGTRWRRA